MVTKEDIKQRLSMALRYVLADANPCIEVRDKKLLIVYNVGYPGLSTLFERDEDVKHYISTSFQDAYHNAIEYINEYTYLINIASVESFGNIADKNGIVMDAGIMSRMLSIYSPIILKFIVDVCSQNFNPFNFRFAATYEDLPQIST